MNERQRAGAERHLDGTARPRAFILTGALAVVCRDPIYIDDLRRRDLKVLVITAAAWHGYAEAHRDDPDHPASAIEEVAFVDGSVESEGSFLPGVIERKIQIESGLPTCDLKLRLPLAVGHCNFY